MYQSKWAPSREEPKIEEKPVTAPAQANTTTEPASGSTVATNSNHTSSYSASAPAFTPAAAAPPTDISTVDSFAQSGAAQDDLFNDEIVPVDQSMRVRSEEDLFSDDFTPAEQPIIEHHAPERIQPRTEAPRARGRGRGRGNGSGARGAGVQSLHNQSASQKAQVPPEPAAAPPENAPSGPRKETAPSVTGDRQATGGLKKPKLTEEELAEKMVNIKIKNASLTAAHARAEADAASFAEREVEAKRVAAQRQKEERRDRQQMMGERERNRLRKLKAMEGREWDSEKQDDDFRRGGKHDKKGGFAGDQEGYNDGREYLYREPKSGGRGPNGGGHGAKKPEQQVAPKKEDFPALAPAKSTSHAALESQITEGAGSWADQVESSNQP